LDFTERMGKLIPYTFKGSEGQETLLKTFVVEAAKSVDDARFYSSVLMHIATKGYVEGDWQNVFITNLLGQAIENGQIDEFDRDYTRNLIKEYARPLITAIRIHENVRKVRQLLKDAKEEKKALRAAMASQSPPASIPSAQPSTSTSQQTVYSKSSKPFKPVVDRDASKKPTEPIYISQPELSERSQNFRKRMQSSPVHHTKRAK
jgi:hypothetical protein